MACSKCKNSKVSWSYKACGNFTKTRVDGDGNPKCASCFESKICYVCMVKLPDYQAGLCDRCRLKCCLACSGPFGDNRIRSTNPLFCTYCMMTLLYESRKFGESRCLATNCENATIGIRNWCVACYVELAYKNYLHPAHKSELICYSCSKGVRPQYFWERVKCSKCHAHNPTPKLKTVDRNVSEKTKQQVAKSQDYKCANSPSQTEYKQYKCLLWTHGNGTFDQSGYEVDHLVALMNGGTNDISNLRALCPNCHRVKTKRDRSRKKT